MTNEYEGSVEDEIADVRMKRPHVSRASLIDRRLETWLMEPRIGRRDRFGDATETADHPRRVLLRIPGRSDSLAIGAREPMRLVAPFGYSSAVDLGMDLERHVRTLADAGADAVQELSTTGPYRELRQRICANIGIPYGTVLT